MIDYFVRNHTAYIILASPQTGNTVNRENLLAIKNMIKTANRTRDIRLIVIRGKEGVFCRGMDFGILATGHNPRNFTAPYMKTVLAIRNSPKPVICLVDGEVLAGGIGLLCASDVVLCSEKSSFGLSEVYFGLVPAYVLPLLLERVPFKKARYMALSSRKLSAGDAYIYGLVDEVVPGEKLEKKLKEYQQRLFFSSPEALGLLKNYSDTLSWQKLDKSLKKAQGQLESLLQNKKITDAIRNFQAGEAFPWSLGYRKGK